MSKYHHEPSRPGSKATSFLCLQCLKKKLKKKKKSSPHLESLQHFKNCFQLEETCFTMLCLFLLYNNVNQLLVYTYPSWASLSSPPTHPTALGHQSTELNSVLYSSFPLAIYFTSVCVLSSLSCVRLFVTLWTVAHQAPLSMGLFKQECWSGLLCPPPGDLPNPGTEPTSPAALALQVSSLLLSLRGSPYFTQNSVYKLMLPSQFVPPSPFSLTVSTNWIHKALNFFFGYALKHVGS